MTYLMTKLFDRCAGQGGRKLGLVIIAVCSALSTLCSSIAIGATTHRLALIVGANDGGPGRTKLRFANKDAATFGAVLRELGGISSQETIVIENGTAAALGKGIEDLRRKLVRLSTLKERLEVIIYYSGHSNEQGLLLGRETFSYQRLKAAIAALPADVRVMVIDACESGTMTASKGGQRRPSFLLDESTKARGQAIITSSSSDEAAQESASVSGSFFTHYLVSGMRGAADINSDGKVTLNEAYQYAYVETLARTERTMAGAQHPAYDFKLAGTGDLTLTDVREASATLTLPAKVSGRYFIRNAGGLLVAEINKPAGRTMELGLVPGAYDLLIEREKQRFSAQFTLDAKTKVDAGALRLVTVAGEVNQTRGDQTSEGEFAPKTYNVVNGHFDVIPKFEDLDEKESHESHRFAFGLLGGRSAKVQGISLGFVGYLVDDGVDGAMLALGVNYDRGYLHGAQFSTFGNYVGTDVEGIQGSAIANYAGGQVSGFQGSSVANIAMGPVTGFQGSAVANVAKGELTGVQASAAANYAQNVSGAQLGIINVTAVSLTGLQAGIVNYARHVKGLQLGIINVTDDIDGVPIGLISYVKNGRKDFDVWGDELGFGHVTYKMGIKKFYTIYDFAGRRGGSGVKRMGGLGFGGMWGEGTLYGFIDGIFLQNYGTQDDVRDEDEKATAAKDDGKSGDEVKLYVIRWQASLGVRIASGVSVFAGPSYCVSNVRRAYFDDVIAPRVAAEKAKHARGAEWVGAIAGLKYEL